MQNTRPFAFDHLEMNKITPPLDPKNTSQIEDFLVTKIEKMLESVNSTNVGRPPEISLPMLRLKIEHTNFAVIRSKRLNDHFANKYIHTFYLLE